MTSTKLRSTLLLLVCSSGFACEAQSPRPVESRPPQVSAPRPTLVAGQVPVAPFVQEQKAVGDGRVLVYVGATWCEPCRHFHDSLLRGELDGLLGAMRVVEYDLDQHRDALALAGYSSRMIPLFVVPGADGRASTQRMEGSIKGERAVPDNLAPRLRELLFVK